MIDRAPARGGRRVRETDRVFLDANILFSAAYRAGTGLERLWDRSLDTTLLSSPYAIEEARRNLEDPQARERLERLIAGLEIVPDAVGGDLPTGVTVPKKDHPILLAAIAAGATPRRKDSKG